MAIPAISLALPGRFNHAKQELSQERDKGTATKINIVTLHYKGTLLVAPRGTATMAINVTVVCVYYVKDYYYVQSKSFKILC